METYKRKLENLGDLKRQMKLLEENNMTYMQNTVSLEEELRKANAARAQLETYKRQVNDMQNSAKPQGPVPPQNKGLFINLSQCTLFSSGAANRQAVVTRLNFLGLFMYISRLPCDRSRSYTGSCLRRRGVQTIWPLR